MEAEDFSVVDICNPLRCDVRRTWKAVDLLAKEVGEGDYRIKLPRLGELSDKVYSNFLPWSLGNVEGPGYCLRVLSMLLSGTGITSFHISPYEGSH